MLDAACIPPWKVHLVENTGYEGLTSREETNRFKREVQAANAYIFTLPYKDRKNDVHYELLGKLIEADECKFLVSVYTIIKRMLLIEGYVQIYNDVFADWHNQGN